MMASSIRTTLVVLGRMDSAILIGEPCHVLAAGLFCGEKKQSPARLLVSGARRAQAAGLDLTPWAALLATATGLRMCSPRVYCTLEPDFRWHRANHPTRKSQAWTEDPPTPLRVPTGCDPRIPSVDRQELSGRVDVTRSLRKSTMIQNPPRCVGDSTCRQIQFFSSSLPRSMVPSLTS